MRIGSLDTIEISDLDLHCKINPTLAWKFEGPKKWDIGLYGS